MGDTKATTSPNFEHNNIALTPQNWQQMIDYNCQIAFFAQQSSFTASIIYTQQGKASIIFLTLCDYLIQQRREVLGEMLRFKADLGSEGSGEQGCLRHDISGEAEDVEGRESNWLSQNKSSRLLLCMGGRG